MMKAEVSSMEDAATPQPALRTRADYEAATQRCLEEIDRLHEQIAGDLNEMGRLKAETRAILARIKGVERDGAGEGAR
jgi:hypothetical protein